jgi:hypothetical protein
MHLGILGGPQVPLQRLREHLALGRKHRSKLLHLEPVGVAVLPNGILRI